MLIDRRYALTGTAAALLTGLLGPNVAIGRAIRPAREAEAALSRIASSYLRTYPGERDVASLLSRLGLRPGKALEAIRSGVGPSPDVARHLHALREAELRRLDVVLVDNWLFARSEARLCALAWLSRRRESPIA